MLTQNAMQKPVLQEDLFGPDLNVLKFYGGLDAQRHNPPENSRLKKIFLGVRALRQIIIRVWQFKCSIGIAPSQITKLISDG